MDADTTAVLRYWASAVRRSTTLRDRYIADARADGATLREIGLACDMSHQQVDRILRKRSDT